MDSNAVLLGGQQLRMPAVGLGTWQASGEEVQAAVHAALEAGYRHIDTAHLYGNEADIGKVLAEWIGSGRLKREDLFITNKLVWIGNRPDKVDHYMKLSLSNMGLDYFDLYLIHFPVGFHGKDEKDFLPMDEATGKVPTEPETDHIALWKALEDQVDAGRTKSIGLSNFNRRQVGRILRAARIPPANLQVEVHAHFQQKGLRDFCRKNGILVSAYGSLGSKGRASFIPQVVIPTVLKDPVVLEIASAHGKTPAQVLLRHLIQGGVAVIPKSVSPARIRENFDLFGGFSLSAQEMERLDELDRKQRTFVFDEFPGIPDHPDYPFGPDEDED